MAVINVSSANVRVRGSRTHELTRENTRVNTASLYALQGKNQEAIDTLNKYNEVVGKGGWLSSDDIASYRSALDNFVSSSNRLRELNRFFSDDYVDDSEDWKKTVSSMEEGYRGISDFYSKWKDEDEYKTALEAQKEYQKNLNYDIDAARREIEEMKSAIDSEYDSFYNETDKDKLSHEGPIQRASRIWGKDASEWLGLSPLSREQNIKIDELKAAVTAKEQEIALAERIQQAAAIRDAALNAPDFAEKSKYNSTVSYSRTLLNPSKLSDYDELYEWINGNEDVKADIQRKDRIYSSDNPYDDGKTWLEKAGYDFINDEERAIYNYIYATAGKDKAKDYLDSIADSLQYRYGKDIANGLKGKTLQEYIFGIEAGIDQFASGVAGIFADGYTPQSATQVASGLVREDLKDKGPNLPDWLGGASLGQVGYDAVTTTSNMLPSILASTAVNFVAPGAGAAVGAGLLGASAGGNAKVEMLNLGYSQEQATIYGVLVGAAEGGMEHLLGGIGALGGKLSGKAVSSIASKVDNAIARVAIKLGNKGGSILKAIAHGSVKLAGNMVSEGFEEGLQEIIDPWLREIATGVDWDDPNIDEVLYSSLLGALSAAGLEGAGVVSEGVNTYKSGKAVQGVYAGVEKLQDVGKLLPADSVAYKIADKVNAQTDAYTIGRLLYEAGGTLSEQNISDITGSLVEKGIERKNAERLAKRYKVILDSGMELSDNGRKILESADPLAASLLETIIGKDTEVYQRTKKYSELLASLGGQASAQAVSGGSAVENASVNQSAAEGKFTASEAVSKNDGATAVLPNDGASVRGRATMVDSDGEVRSVKVQKVSSIDNGVISLELEDGQVVKASDVELDSETDALLYDAVTRYRMSAQDANAFVATYYETSSDMPIEHFTRGFGEAYTYGKYGISERFLTAEDSIAAELSEPVRRFAYDLGKKEGERTAAENQNEVDAKKEASKGDASAKNERKKGGWLFYDGINKSGLTERQRVSAKSLEVVAKVLGVNIHLYESSLDSEGNRSFTMKNGTVTRANGWYDVKTGDIYIDINSGVGGDGVMLFTAAHELVHDIAVHAPAKFKILADFLMEQYGNKGVSVDMLVQAQIDKAARDDRTIDYDTAYEEVIADSCESLLSDGDVIKKLAELKARDEGLFEKIKSFITKLVARIKKAYAGMKPDSYEGRIVSEMVDEAERLKELFADALLDASEARASGAKVENGSSGIKFSIREEYQQEIEQWENEGKPDGEVFVLGSTSDVIQGLGAIDNDIFFRSEKINEILKVHPEITLNEIKKIPQILENPVLILKSKNVGRGSKDNTRLVIFGSVKATNRQPVLSILDLRPIENKVVIDDMQKLTSAYTKDSDPVSFIKESDVLYADKNKATSLLRTIGFQMPIALNDSGFVGSISYNGPVVNISGKKFSEIFSEDDIRYSGRDPIDIEQYKKVNRQLEKENAELKEDVVALKELVKLQRKVTHGQVLKPSSLDAVARNIMRESNAKGDSKDFSRLLSDVYQYIINGQDVTWDGIIEKSQPAVQWLLNHEGGVAHRTEFAQEVLSFFKGYSFSLSEGQKSEVANQYGSFNDFRKRAFGSLSINKNATSLDSLWGEICEAFPSLFDPETSDKDQPLVLMSVIDSMKNSYQMEFEFDDDMRAQELLTKIYDGYWAVSTLHTVADSMQVQINRLKYKHSEQMSQIKTSHENSVAELKRDFQKRLDSLKKSKEERYNKTVEHFRESRKKAVEGREKTAMRSKIRNIVNKLEGLLKNSNKKKNIKEELQDTVASSLALASVLFSDEIRNEDIVRLGVDSVTESESILINEYRSILEKKDSLQARLDAVYHDPQSNEIEKIKKELYGIKRRISSLDKNLSDVFVRERARLNKSTVNTIIGNLKDEYYKLQKSENDYIKNAYSQYSYDRLNALQESLEGMSVRDMDIFQLTELYDAFKSIEHLIRTSDKIFREGRAEELSSYVSKTQGEILDVTSEKKALPVILAKAEGFVNNFTWENHRPIDAFERLGSKTLENLYFDYLYGLIESARTIDEYGDKLETARKKHGFSKWKLNLADTVFKTIDGVDFKPTLDEKLSIYAYSQRSQAESHITEGGFQYDTGSTYKETKNGITYERPVLSKTLRLDKATIASVISSLTNEQRAYVDDILPLLTELGEKGNKASNTLYGIDLFKEKVYFPLMSSKDFLSSKTQVLGETPTVSSLSNAGFTERTKPGANNPIVLKGFDDVIVDHIKKMSDYSSLVVPIENMKRVLDNISRDSENGLPTSTKQLIGSRFGVEAERYFEQMLTDFNGGVSGQGAKSPFAEMFTRSKGMAVAFNMSVIVQQYFAIYRAAEFVDIQYFIPFLHFNAKKRSTDLKQYEELRKYAPIAILKEFGGFDVGGSGRSKDLIGFRGARIDGKYINKKISDITMYGAEMMDKLGWTKIWKAVKAEVASKQKLTPGTEEFFTACGKRFTEVVTRTQVFDSVASKSGFMRSKNDLVKLGTSFMGEPTIIINRPLIAGIKFFRAVKSKNKQAILSASKHLARVATVIAISQMLGNLVKSFEYAKRDDDDEEEEAFLEKWALHFASALREDLNPLNSVPFGRDIVSLLEGYNVERGDLTLIGDFIMSYNNMIKHIENEEFTFNDALSIVGSLGNLLGYPLKNLIREIKAAVNFAGDISDDVEPVNMWGAFSEGWTGKSTRQLLYEAYLNGDTEEIKRLERKYDSQSDITSAIRRALRDNDKRIKEAAIAKNSGDNARYEAIAMEILNEGFFLQSDIAAAINAEINELNKDNKPESEVSDKEVGWFTIDDYFVSIQSGDKQTADHVREEIINTYIANGRDRDEAEAAFDSSLRSSLRKYDSRIRDAAMAQYKLDVQGRIAIQKEILAEKNFSWDNIRLATSAEVEFIYDKIKDAKKAMDSGNTKVYDDIIEELIERGYPEDFILKALKK